jgi:uncharacterized protein (DUF58 family)
MWKNFLTSLGLLAIAMVAALYSSSAGRDGRVVASAFSALAALCIAVWVGIRFVPRLASGVDWDWLPFFSHHQVTREGWLYFATLTIVVFGAINTANNLLYMVLSSLLALWVLSNFLSALNFRLVRMTVRVPSHCYAGQPFPISIEVENEKQVFPTFSISFEPAQGSAFRFTPFYVSVIRGLERVSRTGQAVLPRRGRYAFRELKAASRHPFGFFLKNKNRPAAAECICYPEILPESRMDFSSVDVRGFKQRFERGFGSDLYTIRDYLPSDSARHVHWKASAKTSILKTREYAAEDSSRVILAFDRYARPEDGERFERLVSYAASLAYHLIHSGVEVQFVTDEWQGASLDAILEYLALVEMSTTAGMPVVHDDVVKLSVRGTRGTTEHRAGL